MTIYRYGPIAWLWRAFAVLGISAALFLIYVAAQVGELWPVAIALPLALPSIVLPWVLATRIDIIDDDEVLVTNLFFFQRRLSRDVLGRPWMRLKAYTEFVEFDAPRAWIPVQGGLPVLVDLLADIPDPSALRKAFNLPRS